MTMEQWAIEMIKGITVGKWVKDENIYVAQIGNIKFKYLPETRDGFIAQLVIRERVPATKESRELWTILRTFLVETREWEAFIEADRRHNLVDDICAHPEKYFEGAGGA
jgi:hypothetical protein